MHSDPLSIEQAVRQHTVDKLLDRTPTLSVDDVLPDADKVVTYVLNGTLPGQQDGA